ncbi:MAG: hypothetical protein OSJ27_10000 [Candidatus Gastranaerophilales bacterium]|nr:hypothetical protein [Candidatus Gastranaerophilales bacterium]
MANSLEFAKKFLPVLDDIYKYSSITQGMDAGKKVDFTGTNEVNVLKTHTTGLGDYSRTNGYPKGDITANWEILKLTEERGKELSIDRMDNEEMANVFGIITGQFMRDWVVPEVDAFRFAKYASASDISKATGAVLTKDTILAAIDEAVRQMNADEVPLQGRILYINSDLQPLLNHAVARSWGSQSAISTMLTNYNGIPIKYVPPTRFYSEIELNDGSAAWGYKKAASGKNINFMLIYPEAVLQVVKLALPKVFTPDENQDKDMWKFQFRIYHDAFVYENKATGIYLHESTT